MVRPFGGVLDAGNQIQIPTTQNCDSTNGIYCIVCSKYNKLYVGETGLSIRKRINIHRSDVRLKKDTAVATHFNSRSCRAIHLRVLHLEVLKDTENITLNKIGQLEVQRKWQLALQTFLNSAQIRFLPPRMVASSPLLLPTLQMRRR